jgi:hypothetical protein
MMMVSLIVVSIRQYIENLWKGQMRLFTLSGWTINILINARSRTELPIIISQNILRLISKHSLWRKHGIYTLSMSVDPQVASTTAVSQNFEVMNQLNAF